jgi:anti-sigma regulatory factor (Ser/Thr protein kinase)
VSRLSLDLPARPDSISQARDALGQLRPAVDEPTLLNLRLLVSEVVTNAVRHTGASPDARLRLVVESRDDAVRVEVHDEGPGFEAPSDPRPRPEGTSGWGLVLVQKLSRAWGTEPPPGAHVWFELPTG